MLQHFHRNVRVTCTRRSVLYQVVPGTASYPEVYFQKHKILLKLLLLTIYDNVPDLGWKEKEKLVGTL